MRINHPSERSFAALPGVSRSGVSRIESCLRCYCIGSGNSKSTASQAQVTATDEGIVGQGDSVNARDGSFAVGAGGRYTEAGSAQIADSSNFGNISNAAGGTINLGLQGDSVGQLVENFTTASADQLHAFNALLASQNETIADATTDKTKNNSLAWIAAGAIAAFVLGTFLKR